MRINKLISTKKKLTLGRDNLINKENLSKDMQTLKCFTLLCNILIVFNCQKLVFQSTAIEKFIKIQILS